LPDLQALKKAPSRGEQLMSVHPQEMCWPSIGLAHVPSDNRQSDALRRLLPAVLSKHGM
jgi:hypothetical protein